MNKIISSLKQMQRMERLAANVYKQQIRAFKGTDIHKTMQDAFENEKEHAGTLAQAISRHNASPSAIGFLFGFAGGMAGLVTPLLGKKTLFSIDSYIERMAVRDYKKFMESNKYDLETVTLLIRIIEDEKRHIENWNAAAGALKRKVQS
jgi:demethoxyubiquinone hydroxylase (CLK1/Coq7/Cat5 family)